MLMTLQGFWTVALYFGLLGIIWLPRYYVIPTKLRLWPSYWLYNVFSNNVPPLSSAALYEKIIYTPRNYTLNVDYKNGCFTCDLTIQPKHCSTLLYSDVIFNSIHTSDSYDVYTYENYPCYQTVARQGQCVVDDLSSTVFSGAGCTLCSLCHKNVMFNTTHRSHYRKYSYTPRFSISLGNPKRGTKHILHCLSKLVLLRFYDKPQFCDELRQHLSVYRQGKTTVFTGCSTFCSDSSNVVYRELYNMELGVYLILLAGVVLCISGVVSCVGYTWALYRELGVINLAWNSSLTCPICMDKLYRFRRISTLCCGHMFCRGCLNQWLYVFCHVTCPLCRQPVDPNTPLLSTRDTTPQVLMLSDTAHSESEEEGSVAGSEHSTTSTMQSSIMMSIYNIGRNVVAGWSSHSRSSLSDFQVQGDRSSDSLLSNGNVVSGALHTLDTVPDIITVTSEPIPLPYYPLYSSTSSNSIIVPYSRRPSPNSSLPCTSNFPTFLCPARSNPYSASLGFHDNASQDLSAHSDTELFGASSRLQDRIARKINRLKSRRLGLRMRRAQSTSDITSLTSQSESELDVL